MEKRNPNKKLSVDLLIGISGSGKSTLIKNWKKWANVVVISADQIRFRIYDTENTGISFIPELEPYIWRIFYAELKLAIALKKDIIIDNTNITKQSRAAILKNFIGTNYTKNAIVLETPFEVCCKRNEARKRTVPRDVLESQFRSFQYDLKSIDDEGFDGYLFLRDEKYFKYYKEG